MNTFRRKSGLFLLLISLLIAPACGNSNSTDNNGDDGIPPVTFCPVSDRAYRSGTSMDGAQGSDQDLANAENQDWDEATNAIQSVALKYRSDQDKDFLVVDWDTALLAGRELSGNANGFLDTTSYFLVYKVSFSPSSGTATVEIAVHRGNPYDPNSQPIQTVSGMASIGDTVQLNAGDSMTITTGSTAILFAAQNAAQQLQAMGVFDLPGS